MSHRFLHYCCQRSRHPSLLKSVNTLVTPQSFMRLAHNRKVLILLTLRKQPHLYGTVGTRNYIVYKSRQRLAEMHDRRWTNWTTASLVLVFIVSTYHPSLPHYSRQICCRSTLPRIHIMHLITPSSFLRTSVLCFFTSFSLSVLSCLKSVDVGCVACDFVASSIMLPQ